MSDLYFVPQFSEWQKGTKDKPYSAPDSAAFDALMRDFHFKPDITWHLNDGVFSTVGTKEWDDTNVVAHNSGFRVGRNWRFTTETGATLAWDHAAISDEQVSEVPIWLLLTTEARFDARVNLHAPEDVWNLLPRGQKVSGLTIDLRFSEAVDRWKSLGKKLRVGGGMLSGHQAVFENVTVVNYGALGCENFPLYIQGSVGKYDRDLIAQLDPTKYIFDVARITDCSFKGYYEGSDDQVSLCFIAGGMGERSPGEWVQHYRATAFCLANHGISTGVNKVQGFSIYQTLRGSVIGNVTEGCSVGYYSDWLSSKGVTIEDNTFADCRFHGVQLQLSPVGPGCDQFSCEDMTIGKNRITSLGPNVLLDTVGPSTAMRYIRNIKVEANLTLENRGAENVVIMGGGVPIEEIKKRKGCRPW